MTVALRPSLRTSIGRLAVAGAASLATVIAAAPMAVADDDPTTSEGSGSTDAPAPADEAVPDETPGDDAVEGSDGSSSGESSAQEAAPTSKADASRDIAAAEEDPEPNFGLQKFRVGVRIADGTTVPAGTSTVGSTITITVTDAEGGEDDVICETDESTVDEEGDDPTASFCLLGDLEDPEDLLSPPDFARGAIGRAVVSDDDEIQEDQYFYGGEGETYTIRQTAAVDGLEVDTDVVVIEPCEAENGPFCAPGDDQEGGISLATKVVFEDTAAEVDDSTVSDKGTENDGVLPDTGGADATLLGYAALLMTGGGWLMTRGRRRTSDVGVD